MNGLTWVWLGAFTVFGLLFGSFANVVIWRVPRGRSIVSPGSACPACEHPIRWYDNIPLLSWALLHGRCRDCGEVISWRYPAVEAASGALFFVAAFRWGVGATAPFAAIFFWLLLVLSVIDLDVERLPNVLVAIMAAVGAAGAILYQLSGIEAVPLVGVTAAGPLSSPIVSSLAGAAAGGLLTAAISAVYGSVRGKVGLGMGDIKLVAAMGVFLGLYVLIGFVIANILGVFGGVGSAKISGKSLAEAKVPFGPFLAAGALVAALLGPALWGWYLSAVGLA